MEPSPNPNRNHCTGVKLANVNVNQQEAGAIPGGIDLFDALSGKIQQLQAMVVLISGEGHETFDSMSEDLKTNYLWACETLVGECVSYLRPLGEAITFKKKGA